MNLKKRWMSLFMMLLSLSPTILVMSCTLWLVWESPENEWLRIIICGIVISVYLQWSLYEHTRKDLERTEFIQEVSQKQLQSAPAQNTPAAMQQADAPKPPETQVHPAPIQTAQTPAAKPRVVTEAIIALAKNSPEINRFFAAGKVYFGTDELIAERTADWHVCRDVYGRTVLYDVERFPCFDSYDYLYERRCYRRYVIKVDSLFTVITTEDDSDKISIYEELDEKKAANYSRISPVDFSKFDTTQNAP